MKKTKAQLEQEVETLKAMVAEYQGLFAAKGESVLKSTRKISDLEGDVALKEVIISQLNAKLEMWNKWESRFYSLPWWKRAVLAIKKHIY